MLQLRPSFYMIAGAGANIAVQVGDDGVVVVDAGSTATASDILAAIRKITDAPIRYIINTSAEADHVGEKYGIPEEVILGYPETLYPEYRQKMKTLRSQSIK